VNHQPGAVVFEFGPFRLEPVERRLLRNGQDVALPPKALDLLTVLIEGGGRLVTKEVLLRQVWPDAYVEEANLSYTVSVLRKALEDDPGNGRYIDTVQKRGYRFIAEVRSGMPVTAAESPSITNTPQGSDAAAAAPATPAGWRTRTRAWWVAAVAGAIVLVSGASLLNWRQSNPNAAIPPLRARFDVPVPDGVTLAPFGGLDMSPDGRRVVFTNFVEGRRHLMVRSLESEIPLMLPGTEDAVRPFWSFDSQSIGFFAGEQLKRIGAAGGPVTTLCEARGTKGVPGPSGAWGADGVVLFSLNDGPIYRVSETGGIPRPVTVLDQSHGETSHSVMAFLSDGRRFVFSDARRGATFYVASVDPPSERQTLLVTDPGLYASSIKVASGQIVYNKRGTITAQGFDEQTLHSSGKPLALAQGWSEPTISRTGSIAFRSTEFPHTQLTWIARDGQRLSTVGSSSGYISVELSPSGSRAAVVRGGTWSRSLDLWLVNLTNGVFSRLTTLPGLESDPVWAADERQIAYTGDQSGRRGVYVKDLVTGREEALLVDAANDYAVDQWTPDGRFVIARTMGRRAVLTLPVTGSRKLPPPIEIPWGQDQSQVSPDGNWIAFQSIESDPADLEVYVARFPDFTDKKQVSVAGGQQPRWRRDGQELFYLAADSMMMVVPVRPGIAAIFGTPARLFPVAHNQGTGVSHYDVTADGQRFIVVEPRQPPRDTFTFLLNWFPPSSR